MARYYGLRVLSWVVFAFLVGTMVATVYLGWHFAVDDIAGHRDRLGGRASSGKLTVMGPPESPTRLPRRPRIRPSRRRRAHGRAA